MAILAKFILAKFGYYFPVVLEEKINKNVCLMIHGSKLKSFIFVESLTNIISAIFGSKWPNGLRADEHVKYYC